MKRDNRLIYGAALAVILAGAGGFGLAKLTGHKPVATETTEHEEEAGHLDGIKVKKDPVEAAKWRLIAKKNGFKDKELDDMVAKLPKAQRLKAEVEAAAWNDRIQVDPNLVGGQ